MEDFCLTEARFENVLATQLILTVSSSKALLSRRKCLGFIAPCSYIKQFAS